MVRGQERAPKFADIFITQRHYCCTVNTTCFMAKPNVLGLTEFTGVSINIFLRICIYPGHTFFALTHLGVFHESVSP